MKRRILALTLVLALALALLPAGVLAAGEYVDPAGGWDRYDALIESIRTETDRAARTAMLHEAEDMLMATNCVVPLYYYTGTYAQKSYVDHVSVDGYGNICFAYATTPDGVLQARIATEPETLDPAYNTSVDGACLAASAFSGLYGYDGDGALAPACAESYETSEDGLTYYVGLRRGLKWSDGSALTAGDFAYAWKRAAKADEGYGYMFDVFEGYPDIHVEAPSDDTLVFRLKAPCAYMESLMAFPTFYPVKQSVVEADPEGWWKTPGFVCNGPFVLSAWDHKASMIYTPNPNWYDAGNVRLESLCFNLQENGQAPEQMYRDGQLDFVASPDFFPDAEEEFHSYYELGTYYAGFNAQSPIFAGKTPAQAADMRRAMSLVIDRAAISEMVGGQMPASGIVPPGMADGSGGVFREDPEDGCFNAFAMLDDPEGTLAQARTLLERAGYSFGADGKLSSETPLRLTYATNDGAGNEAVANAIRNSLGALGIEMTVQSMPWIDFLQSDKTDFDMIRGGWIADFNDPVSMLDMWTTDSANNICSFAAGNEPGPGDAAAISRIDLTIHESKIPWDRSLDGDLEGLFRGILTYPEDQLTLMYAQITEEDTGKFIRVAKMGAWEDNEFDAFTPGKTYSLDVGLVPKAGYDFSGEVEIYENGEFAFVKQAGDGVVSGVIAQFVWSDQPAPTLDNFVDIQTYEEQFEDVASDAWYHDSVAKAYELGLVKGASATNYNRRGDIKISETIVLACRIRSIYMNDGETFEQQAGEKYYMPYVRYAIENGIISEGAYEVYNVSATRSEFAAILAKALPVEELQAKNTVSDGAIPDVAVTDANAAEIYLLYRAGVLTGNDKVGTFTPDNPIKRSEVAAIIVRMAIPAERRSVELG